MDHLGGQPGNLRRKLLCIISTSTTTGLHFTVQEVDDGRGLTGKYMISIFLDLNYQARSSSMHIIT
jgi:hypothetical protein